MSEPIDVTRQCPSPMDFLILKRAQNALLRIYVSIVDIPTFATDAAAGGGGRGGLSAAQK